MSEQKPKVAYWCLELELASALSIGAADSVLTDHDAVLDGRGLPMIPGTSLAGVLRSYYSPKDASKYFGRLVEEGELTESTVRVYDATWISGNRAVSVRDNVSLENKVARDGLKFDRQVVERGATFVAHVEITDANVCRPDELEKAFAALACGALTLGGKTSRGMGRVKVVGCLRREFDLSDPDQLEDWLKFDQFSLPTWAEFADASTKQKSCSFAEDDVDESGVVIALTLRPRGAVSVREYSTEPDRPDFSQLHVRDTTLQSNTSGALDAALVPGTSWSGAFRDRYAKLVPKDEDEKGFDATERLFGTVKQVEVGSHEGKDAAADVTREAPQANGVTQTDGEGSTKQHVTRTRRSRIEFSESEIAGGAWKEITRNSIDRFTGGTKDGALFTLRTHYAGETELKIRIRCRGERWDEKTFAPLVVCLADLHNGFLPVGGLTAVGHGMFEIAGAECSVAGETFRSSDGHSFEELLLKHDEQLGADFVVPDVGAIAQGIVGLLPAQEEGSEA